MKTTSYTDLIFENYNLFLKDNHTEFSSPSNAIALLTSDGAFRAYIQALTDGLPAEIRESIYAIAEREREVLLEETAQMGPSTTAIGYTVTYFPVLVDIYSEPILAQVATTYPTNQPIVSIPKYKIKAKVKNPDNTVSTWIIPRPQHLVRSNLYETNAAPGSTVNLFTLSGLDPSVLRVNRRFFTVKALNMTDDAGGAVPYNVPVLIRPDARGRIDQKIEFRDSGNNQALIKLIGSVNWDDGSVTLSYVVEGVAGVNYTLNYARCSVMFSPTTGNVGRVKVSVEKEMWDVNIDVRDDFEIELSPEMIQDYRDIYNIDLVRSFSEAIKTQILLNKDQDIAYMLEANEVVMQENSAYATVDLQDFTAGAQYRPANILDIFKGVIPRINSIARIIHLNYRAAPQFIVSGLKTSALLDSLQEYIVNIPDVTSGEYGFASGAVSFRSMKIVPCLAVPEDKIYLIYKAPVDKPQYSSIIDIIYQPLYIVEEITDSMKRVFVKSRTAIEIPNPLALGCIKVESLNDFLL
ncbi:MAG: hypothetical protein QXD03_03630 [Candidatus Anstonellales archaeon]